MLIMRSKFDLRKDVLLISPEDRQMREECGDNFYEAFIVTLKLPIEGQVPPWGDRKC